MPILLNIGTKRQGLDEEVKAAKDKRGRGVIVSFIKISVEKDKLPVPERTRIEVEGLNALINQ